jgi:hypothetical protein
MVSQLAAMAEPAAKAEIRAARSIRFIISSVRVGEVPLGQLFIAEDAGRTQSLSVVLVLPPVENRPLAPIIAKAVRGIQIQAQSTAAIAAMTRCLWN